MQEKKTHWIGIFARQADALDRNRRVGLDVENFRLQRLAEVQQARQRRRSAGQQDAEPEEFPPRPRAARSGCARIFCCNHDDERGRVSAEKILARDALIIRRREWKDNRRRVVFTNGCFDLLHPGHVRLLEQARALGDALVVGLNSDRSLQELKSPGRPLVPERERAEVMAALEAVDAVTIFDEPTPRELVTALVPDILVKGGDWGENEIVGREEVEAAGGRVVRIPLVEGYSTSQLIARIAGQR